MKRKPIAVAVSATVLPGKEKHKAPERINSDDEIVVTGAIKEAATMMNESPVDVKKSTVWDGEYE